MWAKNALGLSPPAPACIVRGRGVGLKAFAIRKRLTRAQEERMPCEWLGALGPRGCEAIISKRPPQEMFSAPVPALLTWTVADAIARMASSNDRPRIVLLLSSRGS